MSKYKLILVILVAFVLSIFGTGCISNNTESEQILNAPNRHMEIQKENRKQQLERNDNYVPWWKK
jgi:hypothetical protein